MDTVKIFHSDDQESLLEHFGSTVTLVDSYNGIKSASETGISREIIEQHKPDKDHFMLRVIAMGADEYWGRNKNLDAWPADELETHHKTFVTDGAFYREHRHRRKDQRIGKIVHSHYNKPKGWVELLVHGALKPREGEPLTAEPEYERARQGKNVDVSMSSTIHYDVCSCCGHKAPHPRHWCEHMKHGAGKWHDKYQKFAYVTNKVKKFFDISSVANRADRIARFQGYYFPDGSELTKKLASAEPNLNGSDLAQVYGLDPNDYSEPPFKEASEYLRRENQACKSASVDQMEALNRLIDYHKSASLTEKETEALASSRPASLMRKLASFGVVLPFPAFTDVFGGGLADDILGRAEELIPTTPARLPSEMLGAFDMSNAATENCGCGDNVDQMLRGVAERLGMLPESSTPMVGRALTMPSSRTTISISLIPVKEASAKAWAGLYNAYKAASVQHIRQLHGQDALDGLPAIIVANL